MTEGESEWLIIGAGASFGARDYLPRDQRPVLGSELSDYLERWLSANPDTVSGDPPTAGTTADFRQARRRGDSEAETLRLFFADTKVVSKPGATPFEAAMNALLESQLEAPIYTISLVNKVLAKALVHGVGCRFTCGVDSYDEYLRRRWDPKQPDSLRVVSFNYDVLLEEAAVRHVAAEGLIDAVEYRGLTASNDHAHHSRIRLPVYKPHGSINWFDAWSFPGSGNNPNRPAGRISESGLGLDYGPVYVLPGSRANIELHLDSPGQLSLAQYCYRKPIGACESEVKAVRTSCLKALAASPTSSITIVGLALPRDDGADDPFLTDLFEAVRVHTGMKVYVNPSNADCEAAAHRYGLTPREESFAAYIERI